MESGAGLEVERGVEVTEEELTSCSGCCLPGELC